MLMGQTKTGRWRSATGARNKHPTAQPSAMKSLRPLPSTATSIHQALDTLLLTQTHTRNTPQQTNNKQTVKCSFEGSETPNQGWEQGQRHLASTASTPNHSGSHHWRSNRKTESLFSYLNKEENCVCGGLVTFNSVFDFCELS